MRNIVKTSVELLGLYDIDKCVRIDRTDERNEFTLRLGVDDRVDQRALFLFLAANAVKKRGIVVRQLADRQIDLVGLVRDNKQRLLLVALV